MKKNNKLAALFIVFVLLFTLGCGGSSPASPTATGDKGKKKDLKVGLTAAPPTIDMHKTTATLTQQVGWHIFEYLVTLDSKYNVVPSLAEKIEVSPDGKTFTFPLRKGLKFHNGKDLTADDVVASLLRWRKYSTIGRAVVAPATITAKDKDTVVITLPKPSSALLPALAYPSQGAVIMPKEIIDEAGDGNVKKYIGTGPFEFVEWKQNQFIHVKNYAGYKSAPGPASGLSGKKEALVDNIFFYLVPDPATRVAGIQSGEYDTVEQVPTDSYQILKKDPNLDVRVDRPSSYVSMVFNTKSGLFADVKKRQAINAALDSETVLKAIAGSPEFYELNHGLVFKEQIWYVDSGKEKYNQKNPELAKKLLAEAGYNGEPVTIITSRDYDYMYKSAVVLKDTLEKIGMPVKLEVYDWPTVLSKRGNDKLWNIFVTGFLITVEPSQTLYLDSRFKWAGWYNSPKINALLDEMRESPNLDQARKVFEKVQSLYWEEVPTIKFGNVHQVFATRKNVKGAQFFCDKQFWNTSVE